MGQNNYDNLWFSSWIQLKLYRNLADGTWKSFAILCFFLGLLVWPISDTDKVHNKFRKPFYRVQCMVPFVSLCSRSRAEIQDVLIEKKLYDMNAAKLPILEAFKRFIPVVIERPFLPPRDNVEAQAWVDLFKVEALDGWLYKQMAFYSKEPESVTYADRLAVAYVNGELIDCCEKRRPRDIPLTDSFTMWGLSPFQNCQEHICPMKYRWKACDPEEEEQFQNTTKKEIEKKAEKRKTKLSRRAGNAEDELDAMDDESDSDLAHDLDRLNITESSAGGTSSSSATTSTTKNPNNKKKCIPNRIAVLDEYANRKQGLQNAIPWSVKLEDKLHAKEMNQPVVKDIRKIDEQDIVSMLEEFV
ncbi:unnamed protein product [Amoebophrya sp. A120]|nr:unnamed protein product [Amoebophrya sp. A120]|eukprot:GSA120T00008774001.1